MELLIGELIDRVIDKIGDIKIAFIRGLLLLGILLISLWLVVYIIFLGFFTGHWIRSLVLIGIWLVAEGINALGQL